VVNEGGNSGGSVSELSATSATNSTTPVNYAASPTTNMYHPEAVAASAGGMVWVADNVNPILLHSGATVFTSGGSIVSGSPFGGSVLSGPIAVALDANGTAWFANNTSGTVASISADGGTVHTYSCGGNGSQAIAVDRHGNVWVANYFANSISELSNTGTLLISGETGGGLNHPSGIAIDGAGTVWVSNYRSNSLTALAGADATTPGAVLTASGLGSDILTGDANKDPAMSEPYSVAVDPSGSVWVANYGSDALVRFIGLATPVKTPLDGPAQVP
jgi:streptogramin lyase